MSKSSAKAEIRKKKIEILSSREAFIKEYEKTLTFKSEEIDSMLEKIGKTL